LLAEDLAERPSAVRRPAQHKPLRARRVPLDEESPHAAQPLRSVEDEPDRLLARLRGPPPGFLSGLERELDRVLASSDVTSTWASFFTSSHWGSGVVTSLGAGLITRFRIARSVVENTRLFLPSDWQLCSVSSRQYALVGTACRLRNPSS
jgi:hypothetical protein